jgi:nicotinamide-nucleotide amidase
MQKSNTRIVKFCKENNLTLAFAESMTCGLAAHQLSQVKGTSDAFKGSLVCYNGDVKSNLLKISKKLIGKHTAESQQVTDEMAKKLKRIFSADVYAAITGLATPGGSETKSKPVGTVFFAVLFRSKLFRLRKQFRGNALEIKRKACNELYRFIMAKVSAQL